MPPVPGEGGDEAITAVDIAAMAEPTATEVAEQATPSETAETRPQASFPSRVLALLRSAVKAALSAPHIDTKWAGSGLGGSNIDLSVLAQEEKTHYPVVNEARALAKTRGIPAGNIVRFSDGFPADKTWAASYGWQDPHTKETATKEANAG